MRFKQALIMLRPYSLFYWKQLWKDKDNLLNKLVDDHAIHLFLFQDFSYSKLNYKWKLFQFAKAFIELIKKWWFNAHNSSLSMIM